MTLLFSDGDRRLWAAPAHRPEGTLWTFDLAELPGFVPTPNAHEATAQDGVICFAPLGLDKAWMLGGGAHPPPNKKADEVGLGKIGAGEGNRLPVLGSPPPASPLQAGVFPAGPARRALFLP